MADWEYVFYDWWDHMPIDALPLQEVSMSITLSGGGQLTAAVPLYDERYSVGRVEAATIPERTMLCVFRDGRFVWGGRVVDPHDYDSSTGVLSITAEEVVGIYAARYVAFTGQRTATGWAEVKWLLEHTASAADKRWLKSFQGTGGTTTATRIYRTEDLSPLLDQVVEVTGAPTGFDWWVRPDWDSVTSRPCFVKPRVSWRVG
ncbi:hypothetical protein [Planomonospora sp. ID82291]|uniref:hypothetical protein n=1 Tax=Planomonospora sp. ID82291 TaxID=2738136 RepID=UPI0018C3C6D6|nr:hypothetical protein [Planomonospora sp. ID82291]MBG0818246.1 hypothetical protein [Planomonospora sp. ID82291]